MNIWNFSTWDLFEIILCMYVLSVDPHCFGVTYSLSYSSFLLFIESKLKEIYPNFSLIHYLPEVHLRFQ